MSLPISFLRPFAARFAQYGKFGQAALVDQVCTSLRNDKRNPYPIPVGGSNVIGTWGYVAGVNELMAQLGETEQIDNVVFATGSGGTLAGITIGLQLYYRHCSRIPAPTIHAVGVCDDPDYFYNMLEKIGEAMGLSANMDTFREWVQIHQGKALGYAVSTPEEMEFIQQFARCTGIVLDPVYSGKALYHFINLMKENPEQYRNSKVLFWHTGGSLGIYERDNELMASLKDTSRVQRLDVYGKLST